MKKIFILIIFITNIVCSISKAQNTFPASGSVGIGTTTPNTSSLLEVLSVKKGVLIPRMTRAQRDAIATSASGLLIYQTNSTPGFYYYSNTALWTPILPQPGWSLTGNKSTTASNYLGTTDNNSLRIKTNNIQRAVIDNLGNIGIGTTTTGK